MSLSRRFLNLIVDHRAPGARSLRCIDLKRQQLFKETAHGDGSESGEDQDGTYQTRAAEAGGEKVKQETSVGDLKLERIRLPSPSFSFQASGAHDVAYRWNLGCFPLSDRKVLCTDQSGRSFLFDGNTRHVVTVPPLHKPKLSAVSLFIPSSEGDGGGSLFLMESYPQPEEKCSGQPSDEFEAIVYRKVGVTSPSKCWQCQLFRPPPYVNDPTYWKARSGISSYAAIDGGSLICISVKGIGTYCLETASYTWSKVGDWTLPFYGKVEYVPELKLWFGLSADGHQLAAADLSDLDSQPQIVGAWKELNSPCEWKERRNAQLVNLGFGMFCIARFSAVHYDEKVAAPALDPVQLGEFHHGKGVPIPSRESEANEKSCNAERSN
ncbi:hypothetical protein QOZ80_7BG0608560 [Eleusine coracana subsp. coracana]|nr:hypothetical protein QOZ80_7BG0608560 [Eleusine coracana subsp. coracana]